MKILLNNSAVVEFDILKMEDNMIKKVILLVLASMFIAATSYSQIGNENGKYDSIINIGYDILQKLYNEDIKSVEKLYKDTGFQTKSEFKNFIDKENIIWLKHTINAFGITPKPEIDISQWSVKTKGKMSNSINLTFFFKKENTPFSNVNDHVSLSFLVTENEVALKGLMFFKKEDYLMVKNIIDNIPQN